MEQFYVGAAVTDSSVFSVRRGAALLGQRPSRHRNAFSVGPRRGPIALLAALALILTTAAVSGCSGIASQNPPPPSGQLSASPSSVTFGDVEVGTASTQTVTFSNAGTGSLTVSQAAVSGTGFTMTGQTFPVTLSAGQSSSLSVQFTPTVTGTTTGSVSLVSNASNSTSSVTLNGNGVKHQLSITPNNVSFGNVMVGTANVQSVTLTNSGTANLNISQGSVTGAGFGMSGLNFPLSLAPGQSSTFNAQFAPTAPGSASGTVSINSNAHNSPTVASLTGSGTAPALSLSPTSLSFGNAVVGSSSSQALTMTNTGTATLTISQASVAGAAFSVSGATFPLNINPGVSNSLTVTFAPTTTGSASGTLTIASNAPNSPASVALSGSGVQGALTANPSSFNFGNVPVGGSGTQTITLSNSGTASVTISGASASGTGFSIAGLSVPLTLAAGQNTTFSAKFAPSATGSASGSVSITSNAPGSPLTLALSGTGVAATFLLGASPTSLSFGNVNVGGSSGLPVTLTNSGNSNVTVSGVTVTGAGFSASGVSANTILTPSQSVTLNVLFAPGVTGSVTGSVSVTSNATNSPAAISLAATGVQPQISIVPASVSFGNVVVGQTNTQTLTLSNPGSANLIISQATVSGVGYSLSGLTLPLTLAPNQSAQFTVGFAPSAAGSVTGSISIVSNAPNSPAAVSLSGSGVAPVLQLSASPISLSFGNINIGSSTSLPVTLTNTGNSNVSVSQINVTGTGFSFTGLALPVTLSAGQAANFSVVFAPTISGSLTGSASVVSTATNSPATISLSGSGVLVSHSVALSWTASTSTVAGYYVYRGSQTGGPYTKLNAAPVTLTTYTDSTVLSGQSYFYVTTAVDSNGIESIFSNEVSAVIP